ncbi:MAG: peroxidase, partial [Okeania sp. SIO2D1]|nr:peroxidase [Okeania sp. SIO2D1]
MFNLEKILPWHKLPTLVAVLKLVKFRNKMREKNLYDTEQLPRMGEGDKPTSSEDHLKVRTVDGSFNDLQQPAMGKIEARFGRNVPLKYTFPDQEKLFAPSPREISRKVLTRDKFIPASTLNLLAGAWIQFQVHDWFAHGTRSDDKFNIPLKEDDPWPEEHR